MGQRMPQIRMVEVHRMSLRSFGRLLLEELLIELQHHEGEELVPFLGRLDSRMKRTFLTHRDQIAQHSPWQQGAFWCPMRSDRA